MGNDPVKYCKGVGALAAIAISSGHLVGTLRGDLRVMAMARRYPRSWIPETTAGTIRRHSVSCLKMIARDVNAKITQQKRIAITVAASVPSAEMEEIVF